MLAKWKRKTAVEQRERKDPQAWWERGRFFERLWRLSSWVEVRELAASGPKGREPGGTLYTRLAYSLQYGSPPDGADEMEREAYRELVKRLGPLLRRG